jgi:hypothetical protein
VPLPSSAAWRIIDSVMFKPPTDEQIAQLTNALLQGQKISAIKLYRKFTDASLKDAKDAIEELEVQLRAKFPDKMPPTSTKSGCFGAAAGLALMFGLAAYAVAKLCA